MRRVILEVRDDGTHLVRIAVRDVGATFGEVRNEVNVRSGAAVGEHDLVPSPWSHYIADDPELFGKGPGDEWRLGDVFYEALTSATTEVVVLQARSAAPLGPSRRIGLVFADAPRRVDLSSMPEARRYLEVVAQRDDRADGLVSSLASVEAAVRAGDLRRDLVAAVAGFGFDGEVAALVFAGSLTVEDALRALKATSASQRTRSRAYSVVGRAPEDSVEEGSSPQHVVSHRICDRAYVVVVDGGGTQPPPGKPLEHRLVETLAAHTPRCAVEIDDAGFDISEPTLPFYSRGERRSHPSLRDTLHSPVDFAATIRAILEDHADLTDLVVASPDAPNLAAILRVLLAENGKATAAVSALP